MHPALMSFCVAATSRSRNMHTPLMSFCVAAASRSRKLGDRVRNLERPRAVRRPLGALPAGRRKRRRIPDTRGEPDGGQVLQGSCWRFVHHV